MHNCRILRRWFLLAVLWSLGLAAAAPAAEPGRDRIPEWQFKTGQALRWTFDQSLKMEVPRGGGTVVKVRQILDFDVNVTSVEKGMATLAIATSRIRATTELPDGKTAYDSARGDTAKEKESRNNDSPDKNKADVAPDEDDADDDAQNLSRDLIAQTLAPVRNLKYSVTLDSHCAVKSVNIDDKTLSAR
jgi:hypothetical protein